MLTEYSSYDDIRKFRDKVIEKYFDIKGRWLGKDIKKYILNCKRTLNLDDVEKYDEFPTLKKTFKIENQVIHIEIAASCTDDGRIAKKVFSTRIYTQVEKNNGKFRYCFLKNRKDIHIFTPHFVKRMKERFKVHPTIPIAEGDVIPYKRNGVKYELLICDDSIMVTRKIEDDIILFITFLHRDMCTGKNYQELFKRAEEAIDEHDIYEWK